MVASAADRALWHQSLPGSLTLPGEEGRRPEASDPTREEGLGCRLGLRRLSSTQ
jgi:hypothetical protein